MNFKKIIIFFIISIALFSSFSLSYFEENEIIDSNELTHEIESTSSITSEIPSINSKSAIVIDRTSKNILFAKNESNTCKMASTTKIMTAVIVLENSNLNETVIISKNASSVGGSVLGINENDKITVLDLLYGLLLKSGNDSAIALAEHVGGNLENFSDMMNKKALELSLNNTHFITPHGLDNDNHYTTAYELALLTDYALKNQTFYNIVSTKNYTITINNSSKNITNTNELLGNLPGIYGVKTGFTNGANRCLVTACKRNNLDIICVVLGCDTKKLRSQDSIKLIEYTFNTYEMFDIEKYVYQIFDNWKLTNQDKITINKAKTNNLELKIKDFNYKLVPVKKSYIKNILSSIDCKYTIDSPINNNTNIGNLFVKIDEDKILCFEIININIINRKKYSDYYLDLISNFFKYLTIKI